MNRNPVESTAEVQSQDSVHKIPFDITAITVLCEQFCEDYLKFRHLESLHIEKLNAERPSTPLFPQRFDGEKSLHADFLTVQATVNNCRHFSQAWAASQYQKESLHTALIMNLLLCEGQINMAANTFTMYYGGLSEEIQEAIWHAIPGSLEQIFNLNRSPSAEQPENNNDENQRMKKRW